MKTLKERITINEVKGESIDIDWINNNKPIITKNGKAAIVVDIDLGKVPNIIIGKVSVNGNLYDFKWKENGECVFASDINGKPRKPVDGDNLVKNA